MPCYEMAFFIVLTMLTVMTGYLLKRDIKNNERIKKLDKTLKTYVKNGKETKGKTEKTDKAADDGD